MIYFLSLGSNIGNREQTLQAALQQIEQQVGHVDRCSSFFYSEPWGFESKNSFCNLCCRVETELTPLEVLRQTQAIERALGRTHKSVDGHYSDRTVDIDLIRVFDNEGKEIKCTIHNSQFKMHNASTSSAPLLILPHPLWKEREFVRIPLAEVLEDPE